MVKSQRFANVLTAWANDGHTQVEFAKLAKLAASGVSRMFNGDQHPDVGTFGQILAGVVKPYPELARDLLEAYLQDDIPEGTTPDGRAWRDLVRVMVDDITPGGRVREGKPMDELEEAIAYMNRTARTTKHGKQFVIGFYRIKHPVP